MLIKTILIIGMSLVSIGTYAKGWLDVATSVMGAQNAVVMDQAEARMNQSQTQANAAIARADQGYTSHYNQTSNQNNSVYSTGYLKSLDCTDLAVEKRTFERTLEASETSVSQNSTIGLSKWAGVAGTALNAFSGQSETLGKMGQIANSFSGQNNNTQAQANVASGQVSIETARANIENVAIYQNAKKCNL